MLYVYVVLYRKYLCIIFIDELITFSTDVLKHLLCFTGASYQRLAVRNTSMYRRSSRIWYTKSIISREDGTCFRRSISFTRRYSCPRFRYRIFPCLRIGSGRMWCMRCSKTRQQGDCSSYNRIYSFCLSYRRCKIHFSTLDTTLIIVRI